MQACRHANLEIDMLGDYHIAFWIGDKRSLFVCLGDGFYGELPNTGHKVPNV